LPYLYISRSHPYAHVYNWVATEGIQYNYANGYLQWGIKPTWNTIVFLQDTRSGTADGQYTVDGSELRSPTYHEGPAVPIDYQFHSAFNSYIKWYYLPGQSNHVGPGNQVELDFTYNDLANTGKTMTAGFIVKIGP
jgi:hypothetical protein